VFRTRLPPSNGQRGFGSLRIEKDDNDGRCFENNFTDFSGSSITNKHEFESWYFSSHRGGCNLKSKSNVNSDFG
jgi:hypothetical protein